MLEQYSSWNSVQEWISKNPTSSKSLVVRKPQQDIPHQESNEWSTVPVFPISPLSCLMMLQDPMYESLAEQTRHSLIRDECTRLQEQATLHCKGRMWPSSKTIDALAEVCLETRGTYVPLGIRALAYLRECQFILINEQAKSIIFYPEDVSTWLPDVELVFLQSDMRGVYHPPTSFTPSQLSRWLSDKEYEKWTIAWPVMPPTTSMEDLKKMMIKYNESINGKILKDVLRKRVGRAQSIHHLASW